MTTMVRTILPISSRWSETGRVGQAWTSSFWWSHFGSYHSTSRQAAGRARKADASLPPRVFSGGYGDGRILLSVSFCEFADTDPPNRISALATSTALAGRSAVVVLVTSTLVRQAFYCLVPSFADPNRHQHHFW